MLTLVIALASAVMLAALGNLALPDFIGPVWTAILAVLGFLAASIPLNLWVKKRQEALFLQVQAVLAESQQHVRRRVMQMQNKMMSSSKGLQRQLEKQQAAAIEQAIGMLAAAEPLKKWNVLAERQTNTLKGQLAYQLEDFEQADRCFAKSLNMDPLTVCMKMARHYKHGDLAKVDKLFKKMKRRFKDENGALLYGLYSWILLQENRTDQAIDVLQPTDEG